ncbi:hypothetical protein BDF22DRAFT_740826 [Syncephalis plumigaleata]|nr:hypothetical protein BDF22DRAFT_740826 [Syncephalis plumigaleata]
MSFNPELFSMGARFNYPQSSPSATSPLELADVQQEIALIANAIYRERSAELAEDIPENHRNLVTHEMARREDYKRTIELRARSPPREEINPAEDYINEELSEALATGPSIDALASTLSFMGKQTPDTNDNSSNSIMAHQQEMTILNKEEMDKLTDQNAGRSGWRNIPFIQSLTSRTKNKSQKYASRNSPPIDSPRSINSLLMPPELSISAKSSHSTLFPELPSDPYLEVIHRSPAISRRPSRRSFVADSSDDRYATMTGQERQMDAIPFWPITPTTPIMPSFNLNGETDLSAAQTQPPTRIVIVGGSFAGLSVAKELDRQAKRYNLHITLIDPRENLFCNVAFLRACLIDMGRACFINPDQAFTSGRVHRCRTRVAHMEKHHVVLEPWSEERLQQYYNGESTQPTSSGSAFMEPPPATLPFDYAVIAAGSQYPSPMKFSTESVEEAMQEQSRVRTAIQRSNRILIVGGGPSGVELATEIKYYHPDKEVTLVHYARRLIQGEAVRQKLQLRVEKTLRKMGVQLRLNERVLLTENQRMRGWIEGTRHYTTNHGDFIETDLLFVCTGNVRYNTRLVQKLASNTLEEVISRTGEIHVLPTLQLVPYPHIFAIGDCADASPIKLATAAFDQARFCARNICRIIRHRQSYQQRLQRAKYQQQHHSLLVVADDNNNYSSRPYYSTEISEEEYKRVDETAKLARYKPIPKFVLSLGPEDGTGQWPYIGILPSWFACRHKSKKLMLGQIYRFFNAELPTKIQTS